MPTENIQRQDARVLEEKGRKAVTKKFKTLERLVISYVSPDKLYPNAYNPNRQDEEEFELLLRSMTEDGFTVPILAQTSGEIIDGEHRWRAAQRIGLKEIPVVFTDMTAEQMRIATLRHNRARGSEDIEEVIKIFHDLEALGALTHAVDSLGISDKEIRALMNDLPAPEKQASDLFSQSWIPSPTVISTTAEVDVKKREVQAATDSFNSMQQLITKKANEQDSEEARQTILREDMTGNSVIIHLNEDQSTLVLKVLGDTPAHNLLQLCRFYLDKHGLTRWQPPDSWKQQTVKEDE